MLSVSSLEFISWQLLIFFVRLKPSKSFCIVTLQSCSAMKYRQAWFGLTPQRVRGRQNQKSIPCGAYCTPRCSYNGGWHIAPHANSRNPIMNHLRIIQYQ